jgi:Mechanosensitive ion channel
VVATAVLSIGSTLGGIHAPELSTKLTVIGLAGVFVILGVIATRAVASQVAAAAGRAGLGTASAAKLLCRLVGYLVVTLGALGILTIPLQQLLIGGALTGVVLGIAAQQSLANLFARLVLLVTRPFAGRQRVCVHSGALGGPLEGHVLEMGLMHTVLDTGGEAIHIPNSALLSAAISTRPDNGTSDTVMPMKADR